MNIHNSLVGDSSPISYSETILISSLALLKMLRHGRAGIPVEVMGLILGKIEGPIKILVDDVFAMPQTGTGVSVEAIDPVFQTKMLDMLSQVGKASNIVGWYHSHPGFGCWLSGVDINTQQSFEQLNKRAIALVIDPILSIKGKVVLEAFRNFPPYLRNQESREANSIEALITNSTLKKLDHGINRYYYGISINFSRSIIEDKLLLSTLSFKNDEEISKTNPQDYPEIKIILELEKLGFFFRKIKSSQFTGSVNIKNIQEGFQKKMVERSEKLLRYFYKLSLSSYIDSTKTQFLIR
mmetsp:Transcript_41978/g.65590  ORF Transcript_41978/g.65590 Transcript_41978/m.65590 type:complete len:296 (-) Transcript_41978:4393-5280(-)